MQLVRNLELERDVKFIQMVLYAIISYLASVRSRMSGY